MYSLNKPFAPWCLSLVLVAPVQAAFNPGIVAADAQWVAFVDMNGLRASVLGRELIATAQKKMPQPLPPSMGLQFDFEKMLGTIGSVTAYGTSFGAQAKAPDGALIIDGTGDMRKIAEGWLAQASLDGKGEVAEVADLPFPGYVLHNEVFIGFPVEPIIVIGKSKEQIAKAHAVFRGASPSLAQASTSPLAKLLATSSRAYALAASSAPAEGIIGTAPQARILQLVSSGMISVGEQNQQTVARAELVAKSDDMAEKLLKIVQGLTAMVSLTEPNDRQLAEFVKAAAVAKEGRTVTLQVAYSSERIVQMIETAQQLAPRTAQRNQRVRPAFDPATFGTVIGRWSLGGATTSGLAVQTVPNLHLRTGATVTVSAQRATPGGNLPLVDRVDIFPMTDGGAGLRFEAENMRLRNSAVRLLPTASGGRVINVTGAPAPSVAQFEFPGTEGDYILHVHYVEPAENVDLAVSVREAAPAPTEK